MAAFSLSPCTAGRALCGPSRPETEPPATLASEPGHSLATSHPLPPHSVHIGHGICTAAPSMAASKAAGHLPAVTLDHTASCITSKMDSLSNIDESCSLKCCIWHRQLGHHVSPSCAALLHRGVRTKILSCRYPGWPSEEKHHLTGSATRDGGSARAALCPAAGSRTAMLSAALSV